MNTRKLLCSMVALLILMSGSMATCAFALAAGGYAVANTTYYINPDTGVADDGGDTSIGEGMCRNSVYADSFYELKDGRHYLTIRLKLISFISNIAFQVQQVKGDGESYRNVSYTVTGENKEENTRDFRLELPAADALIRPSFFVAPMNRDVTFLCGLTRTRPERMTVLSRPLTTARLESPRNRPPTPAGTRRLCRQNRWVEKHRLTEEQRQPEMRSRQLLRRAETSRLP